MAWSRVGAAQTINLVANPTVTKAVTHNNLLVVYAGIGSATNDPTIADDHSNTWTAFAAVLQDSTNGVGLKAWWAIANATATIVVTITGMPTVSGTNNSVLAEWSGSDAATSTTGTPTGQTQQTPGTGTDAVTSGNTTPAVNGALFVGIVTDGNSETTQEYTAGTSFSLWGAASVDPGGAGNLLNSLEDWTQSTAAAHAATWTSAHGDPSTSLVAAFKPAAAVASPGGSLTTLGVGA